MYTYIYVYIYEPPRWSASAARPERPAASIIYYIQTNIRVYIIHVKISDRPAAPIIYYIHTYIHTYIYTYIHTYKNKYISARRAAAIKNITYVLTHIRIYIHKYI